MANSLEAELTRLLKAMNDQDIRQIDAAIRADIAQRVAWAKAMNQ